MIETISSSKVPVNFGKLLENQLKKWQGGGHHPRGIAEYISNSDDSYRRLEKFADQKITVEIHSRSKKKIEKLIIKDNAEGMSYDELENKFFQYFESFSGRDQGAKVTGRFGTGGKAYAIMNFRHCWIISVQNKKECKAWFQWDIKNKEIVKGYNSNGYKDKPTNEPDGTTIILESSINVTHSLEDFVIQLEKLARIRHVLKSQEVIFKIIRQNKTEVTQLTYSEPNPSDALKTWTFTLPNNLKNDNDSDNQFTLRYYEKPLNDNAYIDLKDGISSVADLQVSFYDNRPFSKYINGELTINRLIDSTAVNENRRGLDEGSDLAEEINIFLSNSIKTIVTEIEELQRNADRERRINATNEKLNELSKFLSKRDLKFKLELKELKKRFTELEDHSNDNNDEDDNDYDQQIIYRKPIPEDTEVTIIKGNWIIKTVEGGSKIPPNENNQEFIPDENGTDLAVKVGAKPRSQFQEKKDKKGLEVLMSNDDKNPDSPIFNQYDDPISDRDLESKGIIWINSVHPIIIKYENHKTNDIVRNENIANFVLMIIAQYYSQKEAELQPEDYRDDLLILFRKHYFKLQMDLRSDPDIAFFETEVYPTN